MAFLKDAGTFFDVFVEPLENSSQLACGWILVSNHVFRWLFEWFDNATKLTDFLRLSPTACFNIYIYIYSIYIYMVYIHIVNTHRFAYLSISYMHAHEH
jgi:hypothetical protein